MSLPSARSLRAAVVLGAVLASSTASAEVIDFTGLGRYGTISSTLRVGSTTITRNVSAGELLWTWQGTTPEGFPTSFYSYCVDLANYLQDPQTVTIGTSEGFTNGVANGGAKAAWLFNTYATAIHNTGTGAQAAALQVAIWEAMYDSSADLSLGNFRLSTQGDIRNYASNYLTALYSAPGGYLESRATILATSAGQDQVTVSVPEPASVLLVGSGLALLARRWRRNAKR